MQRIFVVGAVAAAVLAIGHAQQQTPETPKPTFDVASIKPSSSNAYWWNASPLKGGHGEFRATNATVKQLLTLAYQIREAQIAGGPGWLDSERFNIDAKSDSRTTDDDLPLMLQSLLEFRFHLKAHREIKTVPTYVLVVARAGPKLRRVEDRDCSEKTSPGCSGIRFGGGGLIAENLSMGALATALTSMLRTPVVDETGLIGTYDFKLEFMEPPQAKEQSVASRPGGGALFDGIFGALPQLGLALKSKRSSMEVLIVDSIERPSAN